MSPRLLPVVILALAACNAPSQDVEIEESDRILVTVDDAPITVGDFERSYVLSLIASGETDNEKQRDLHLANLIDAELLYREALRRGLQNDSVSIVFTERARKKALGGRFFETAFLETLQPLSDAETRRAFARSKEKAVVRHLFFRDSVSANEALGRLDAGADFLEEARRNYGLDEINPEAGYLGPVGYFNVDDAFAEAAFSLTEIGQYSAPVRSHFGYHIIRLENRIRSPLITESEYQVKKDGISSQVRLRIRRLEGDRFVRDYMTDLGVVVNVDGINALNAELELLEKTSMPDDVRLLQPDDLILPLSPVDIGPSTPLAQYQFHGESRTFTAEEYGFWLPDLNFSEARHRTAASVGRALRNEVFALEAVRQGLEDDPVISSEVEYQRRIFLAERLRAALRMDTSIVISDETLMAVRERLSLGVDEMKEMEEIVAPYLPEYQLLSERRAEAAIEVDSVLFKEIAAFGD